MLEQLWKQCCRPTQCSTATADFWLRIIKEHYSEPHRKYHNWRHIEEVARGIQEFESGLDNTTPLYLAAILHDVIYDPKLTDNEAESAAFSIRALKEIGFSAATSDHVVELVLATEEHQASDKVDFRVFLDCDLLILAAEPERYQEYAGEIRSEYAFVFEELFRNRRKEVLTRFLNNDTIYQHTPIRDRHESAARRNLEWEINQLRDLTDD